jgi:fumarate reductase flavoprotein subunit
MRHPAGMLTLWTALACAPEIEDTDVVAVDPPEATTDVLVIGSGPAGLSAAETAVEAGLDVVILEKEAAPGGSGWYAARFLGIGTRFQREKGVEDTVDAAIADWPKLSGGVEADDHVRQLLTRSSDLIDWLTDDLGAGFLFLGDELGQDPIPRIHTLDTADHSPMHALVDRLNDRIELERMATELVFEDGAVVGSRYQDTVSGDTGWIAAKATIVASGGFARNAERLLRDRPEFADVPYLVEIGFPADGGGIELLEAAGAQWQNRGATGFYTHSIEDPDRPGETLWPPNLQDGLFLDMDGHRVANEETMTGFLLVDRLLAAPQKRLFAVLPSASIVGRALSVPPYNVGVGDPQAIPAVNLIERGVIPVYDDPMDLADALGIDAVATQATFDRYESFVAMGEDLDFGKASEGLRTFHGDSLVVLELRPGAAKSYSGFATDLGGRITAANGEPIPGLYGAGEAIGALGSPGAGRGFSGSISAIYLTGILAGESAVSDAAR